jgi:2-hydroxychromene-2-carboxylate isomerase
MTESHDETDPRNHSVTMWLDPVCPFSWNTARWLVKASAAVGFDIDWQLANLAILNEGRELPPQQQARMADSRRIGRLMAAIQRDTGSAGLSAAYFTFGRHYFDDSPGVVDDAVISQVIQSANADDVSPAALEDSSLDELVAKSHAAGQAALGETGGSPIVSVDGHAFFGPVLTSVPTDDQTVPLFTALATLATTSSFTQLQRPRPAH